MSYYQLTKQQAKKLRIRLDSSSPEEITNILKAIKMDLQQHKSQSKHFMKMMSKFVTSHWNENDTFIQNGRLLKLLTNALVLCLKDHDNAAGLVNSLVKRLGNKLIQLVNENVSNPSNSSAEAGKQAASCLTFIVVTHPQTRLVISEMLYEIVADENVNVVIALVDSSLAIVETETLHQKQQRRQLEEEEEEAQALAEYEKIETEINKLVRVAELLVMLGSSSDSTDAIAELRSMVENGDCTLSKEDMQTLTLVHMEHDGKIQQRQVHMLEALCRKANITLPDAEASLLLTPAAASTPAPAQVSTILLPSHQDQEHLSPVSEGNEENEEVPVNTPRPKRPPQAAPRTPGQGLFLCNSISPVVSNSQDSSIKSADS